MIKVSWAMSSASECIPGKPIEESVDRVVVPLKQRTNDCSQPAAARSQSVASSSSPDMVGVLTLETRWRDIPWSFFTPGKKISQVRRAEPPGDLRSKLSSALARRSATRQPPAPADRPALDRNMSKPASIARRRSSERLKAVSAMAGIRSATLFPTPGWCGQIHIHPSRASRYR